MRFDWLKSFREGLAASQSFSGRRILRVRRGARQLESHATEALECRVMLAGATGEVSFEAKISDTAGNFTAVLDDYDYFGSAITDLGDLDGDGVNDMAVAAPLDDDGISGENRGAVYVLFMNEDASVRTHVKYSDPMEDFLDVGDGFGSSVANIGDLDGDGVNDLAVGASGDDGTDNNYLTSGILYILLLNSNGSIKDLLDVRASGVGAGDSFGSSVAGLGDVDGDGVPDLAVGAPGDDDGGSERGSIYVLFMNDDGTIKSEQKISDTAGSFTGTLDNLDRFGGVLANLGDLDGDGVTDLVVGVTSDDDGGSQRGAAYVLFLDDDGTVNSFQKISDTEGNFTATLENIDYFGSSLTGLGDLDGDGILDLAVGAEEDGDGGGSGTGAVYVLFLDDDGTVKSFQKISDTEGNLSSDLDQEDNFGASLANLGDLNGDGLPEIGVGTPGDDDGGALRQHGAVYVLSLVGAVEIIDNGDTGYSTVGTWTQSTNANARDGDLDHAPAGYGARKARWEFTGLASGNYSVAATWNEHSNRSTNSPFVALDDNDTILNSTVVNQELAPADFTDPANGGDWENLFVIAVTDGTLTIELSNAGDEYVIADAIRIVQTTSPASPVAWIVDDGDAGFATSGSWTLPMVFNGRHNDLRNHAAGSGANTATWTFTGLAAGEYSIAATWLEHSNRATNAPFRVLDGSGGSELDSVLVNQESAPNDFDDRGSSWENLFTVTITGTELVVELSDDANEYVIADAIRVVSTA